MNRCARAGFRESVGRALDVVPSRVLERLTGVQFFLGADPVLAGLTLWDYTGDGRSYRDTAHVLYDFHQHHRPADDRPVTVVIPELEPPEVVVHELGHALDHALGFSHEARPVTAYAATNRHEAFAEAFTAWLWPGYVTWTVDDPATRHLFEGLVA